MTVDAGTHFSRLDRRQFEAPVQQVVFQEYADAVLLTSDIFSRNPLTYKDFVRKMGHYIPAAGRNVRPPEAGYCRRGAPLGLRGGAYSNGTRFQASPSVR